MKDTRRGYFYFDDEPQPPLGDAGGVKLITRKGFDLAERYPLAAGAIAACELVSASSRSATQASGSVC